MTHQAVVAALQAFKQEHALDPRAVTRVVIRGAPRIMEERHSERAPHDVLGGQYSLPFTTAVALTRNMSDPLVYDEDRGARGDLIRDLARRIELVPMADAGHGAPGVWSSEILLECGAEHHTLRTRPYKGSSLNPFTWDDACEKFQRYTRSILPAARATSIIDAVFRLDTTPDLSTLAPLL